MRLHSPSASPHSAHGMAGQRDFAGLSVQGLHTVAIVPLKRNLFESFRSLVDHGCRGQISGPGNKT